mgnify:CR=1 FL=1
MFKIVIAVILLLLSTNLSPSAFAQDAAPREAVASFLNAVRSMKFPPADEAGQKALVEKANAFLDLELLCKKALDPHWDAASEEERKSFLDLMGRLIETVGYPKSSRFMANYEITYPAVTPAGNGFDVQSVVKQEEEGLDAEVIYHVYEEGGAWKIDDVTLDGVSITEDLKYQFDKIIAESGFAGLLDSMKKRLADAQNPPAEPAA